MNTYAKLWNRLVLLHAFIVAVLVVVSLKYSSILNLIPAFLAVRFSLMQISKKISKGFRAERNFLKILRCVCKKSKKEPDMLYDIPIKGINLDFVLLFEEGLLVFEIKSYNVPKKGRLSGYIKYMLLEHLKKSGLNPRRTLVKVLVVNANSEGLKKNLKLEIESFCSCNKKISQDYLSRIKKALLVGPRGFEPRTNGL